MTTRLLLLVILLGIGNQSNTQTLYRMNNVPIYHGNSSIQNPFTGGMNASIINQMDLNNDGLKDLVICQQKDERPNRIQTYINKGNANYTYTPRYEAFFPKNLNALFFLRDFNEDKLEDLIFKVNGYFILYYSSRINDSSFVFTLYDTLESTSYDPLYGKQTITPINFYSPVFRDVDKDGDVDIIYVRNGSMTKDIYFYKNYKKEKGLPANQNDFYNENKHYGLNTFSLNPLAFVSSSYNVIEKGLAPPQRTLTPRHDDFQMIWDLDANNDGLYDAVAYSENQRNGPLGINNGSKDSTHIYNYDTYFPSYSKPINNIMSVGYWYDIDNDSKNDILSSYFIERDNNTTTLAGKLFNDDINTIWYYKNFGLKSNTYSGGNPNNIDSFGHITDSFLSKETIDIGTGSQPIFYNYDEDSLVDIIVPSYLKRDSWEVASIAYYKNIGSKTQPQYKLITKDLFNYKAKSRLNIRMASGDLNGDGKLDLLISSIEKNTNYARLTSFPSSPLTPIIYDVFYQKSNNGNILFLSDTLNIDYVDKYGRSNLCLYDVDKDGKTDLFIGDLFQLKYYRNMGTATTPLFNIVTADSVISPCELYCTSLMDFNFFPSVWKDKSDNKEYLLFSYYLDGGKIGKAIIDTQKLKNNQSLTISSSNFYSNYSFGILPTLNIKDVTNDGVDEVIFGNYAGGVQMFSFDSLTGLKDPPPPPPLSIDRKSVV